MKKSIFFAAILIAALGFTGCGGSEKGVDLTVKVKVMHGDLLNNQIDEARAVGYIDLGGGSWDDIIIATAPFKNGGFKITLPEKMDERLLKPLNLESWFSGVSNLTISNKDVVGTQLDNFEAFKNNSFVGRFCSYYTGDVYNYGGRGEIFFLFFDGDCKISGSHTETIGSEKYEFTIDMNLKKGWNMCYYTYISAGNIVIQKYTTKKPELDFGWYFEYWGGYYAPPKDAKPFKFFKER